MQPHEFHSHEIPCVYTVSRGTRYIIYADHDRREANLGFFNISGHEIRNPSRMKFFTHTFQVSVKIYSKKFYSDRIKKGRGKSNGFLTILVFVSQVKFENPSFVWPVLIRCDRVWNERYAALFAGWDLWNSSVKCIPPRDRIPKVCLATLSPRHALAKIARIHARQFFTRKIRR